MTEDGARVVHLRRGGTSVLARLDPDDLPVVLHWGPDLGDLPDDGLDAVVTALGMPYVDSVVMTQEAVSVLPRHSAGWLGRPGLSGSRAGRAWSVRYDGGVRHEVDEAGRRVTTGDGAARLTSVATDATSGLEVTTELEVRDSGLVRLRAAVRNLGDEVYEVGHLEPALPVPAEAGELLDMAGRHTHEREPQRRSFDLGQWVREAWGGRPGHDSATVLCAGRPGLRLPDGPGVGRAPGLERQPGAVGRALLHRLAAAARRRAAAARRGAPRAAGSSYRSPWLTASWGEGLDELSSRFHRHLRARPQHPRTPAQGAAEHLGGGATSTSTSTSWWRWPSVPPRSASSATSSTTAGSATGATTARGWATGSSTRSVFPDGLRPLVDRVHELGLDFGLWFEPEAVNPDSDLARAHPEWILQTEHGPGVESRFQQVLDLGHHDAYAYVLDRMSALVAELDVAFVKWDHNRALVDAGHAPTGTPGVHAQTEAAYRLMDELKARHTGLEIESCCGGGGRLDLGMIDHADRVWVSDCIDAHERHRLVRWTGLTLPPELMGTHVGSAPDHSTGRVPRPVLPRRYGAVGTPRRRGRPHRDERRPTCAALAVVDRLPQGGARPVAPRGRRPGRPDQPGPEPRRRRGRRPQRRAVPVVRARPHADLARRAGDAPGARPRRSLPCPRAGAGGRRRARRLGAGLGARRRGAHRAGARGGRHPGAAPRRRPPRPLAREERGMTTSGRTDRTAVSIIDVAQLAGVSRQTVSNVVNDRGGFSEETRRGCAQVIAETGYKPNRAARQLRTNRARHIGFPLHTGHVDPRNPFTLLFLKAVADAVKPLGHSLIVFACGDHDEDTFRSWARSGEIDGFVFDRVVPGDYRTAACAELDIPFSVMGRTGEDEAQSWVEVDNRSGMSSLVDYLVGRGRRRFAFVDHGGSQPWVVERIEAAHDRIAEHGLELPEWAVLRGAYADLADASDEMLRRPDRPDAIIGGSDVLALLAATRIREAGLAHRHRRRRDRLRRRHAGLADRRHPHHRADPGDPRRRDARHPADGASSTAVRRPSAAWCCPPSWSSAPAPEAAGVLRSDTHWIWDSSIADTGADYHLFYLQAHRSLGDAGLRHLSATVGHAVSTDLVDWEVLPEALGPTPGSWDDLSIWTGSTVLGDDGTWRMFYTATSTRGYGVKDQRVGLAESDDLVTWRKVGTAPLLVSDPRWYKTLPEDVTASETWRDPQVFRDPGATAGTC